ncbi:MAG: Sir2 family NAD-dependent protein deacetylase [Bradyrhizobium sp.]|nr:Sir2 family NAD-dependent protein deacetylase [Bradyrhizobium sp.]
MINDSLGADEDMLTDLENLADTIRARRAILFAGAGVSMSVGLPSWSELITHMRNELGLGAEEPVTSYQTLAEYYRLKYGSIGPLRSWMDRHWSVAEGRVRESAIHQLIVGFNFPVVYTTNYDNNLEVAYRGHGRAFTKIANPSDLAHASDGESQIIKFHGDFDDDQSLVIAETDYFKRLYFDTPLDVRFKADALSKTVLFVGYSMSDLNIRLLLYRLWRTWRESGRERDRPQSYVFTARRDPVQEAVLGQWGIRVLSEEGEPAAALELFLNRLKGLVESGPA